MDSRREFLRKALLLSGTAGFSHLVPESIQRALAINPDPGSTYLDAEHVVILMQENRSFDHCFGTLRGVRGFNDPRAISLPDNNLVWLQSNANRETYAPFRLDIHETKATWMGALPHIRNDQVDAYNGGRHDKWLDAKRPANKQYAGMPLTMGYYTREDIPFNYALADAFTVCDQHFCSVMTSTIPNRLYLWSGTIREQPRPESKAYVRNEDVAYAAVGWKSFPQRLQENNISWKVYQNEISCGGGFKGEESSWLSNFGCNPLEYFTAFHVKKAEKYLKSLEIRINKLQEELNKLWPQLPASASPDDQRYAKLRETIATKEAVLSDTREELKKWTDFNFEELPAKEKEMFQRAFATNAGDPSYRELTSIEYDDNGVQRKVTIPKGDVLHQFRADVNSGQLPAVSWIVGPQNFSDHPSAPWYGAWYVSEVMDILTRNPEVWKKTIFILTYDENDGYFDHVPPFVAPDPLVPGSGKCSQGIDAAVERIRAAQEIQEGVNPKQARDAAIGLGYRVPLIIASPWSRGGQVCSQVFDHTSSLQFLETFLSKKTGRNIREDNISAWRRTVCGDLTAVFNPYTGQAPEPLPFLDRIPFVEGIHKAKWKKLPSGYKKLTNKEIQELNHSPAASPYMPGQEPGARPACALPYELYVDAVLSRDKKEVQMVLKAGNEVFGNRAAGAPFTVYALRSSSSADATGWCRSYAVKAGDQLSDTWSLKSFKGRNYHLRACGPNGFLREFTGNAADPLVELSASYEQNGRTVPQLTGNLVISLRNLSPDKKYKIEITDRAYGNGPIRRELQPSSVSPDIVQVVVDLSRSFGWYDLLVTVEGAGSFQRRYAGRVETGKQTYSDPVIGRTEQ